MTLTYLELEMIPAWHASVHVALKALTISAEMSFNSAVHLSLLLKVNLVHLADLSPSLSFSVVVMFLHSYLSSSATSVFITGCVYMLPVHTSSPYIHLFLFLTSLRNTL